MEQKFGFPVVTANSIFDVLDGLGIKPWPKRWGPISLAEYFKRSLTDGEKTEAERFCPKAEAIQYDHPSGEPFTGFRLVGRDNITVFTLFPDNYLPIVAEWKHGTEEIVIVPPTGVVNAEDRKTSDPMLTCAKREFEKETGFELASVTRIGQPIAGSSRQSTERIEIAVGTLAEPLNNIGQNLGKYENLVVVMIHIDEWIKLIRTGDASDKSAICSTYMALDHLGAITIHLN